MSKHTPAPWKLQDGDGFNRAEIVTDDKAVCSMWRNMGEDDAANAALITAAPDLLAALELALQGLEVAAERSPQTGDDAFIGYALAADKARAAIAKAKGQQ